MNLVTIHGYILFYFFFIPWFLLMSIILIAINAISNFICDYRIGWMNPGTFSVALPFCHSGVSEYSLVFSTSISDWFSTSQSSSLSFGLSKSPFQLSQFSVSGMVSGNLSTSLWRQWGSIHLIQHTVNIWICPPGRLFAHKAGGTGDFSDNLNAAVTSYCQSDQDALTICSISEMYPMAVICLFWVQDSFLCNL